jgi:DNA-binding transcriptional ArsR family regulator
LVRDAYRIDGEIDIVPVTSLLGSRARARMLDALLDGQPHSAGELAQRGGVAASTASAHLSRMVTGGLVAVEPHGRQRLYRLASPAVAEALEALGRLAPAVPVRSLSGATRAQAFRQARTCYDHLAGRLGVEVTQALVMRDALRLGDDLFALTPSGERLLVGIGVDVAEARQARRRFARVCPDLSEARPHLAGALGAGLIVSFLERDWVRRRPADRALTVTPDGRERLSAEFGLELD